MNLKEHLIECPKCGHHFSIYTTRHGAIGSGAHYASQISKLNSTHELILQTLQDIGAESFETGITLTNFWIKVRQVCLETGRPVPTKQGLSGRLSELQGMGKTRCERNIVKLKDRDSMQFRFKSEQRWFLVKEKVGLNKEQQQESLSFDKVFFR